MPPSKADLCGDQPKQVGTFLVPSINSLPDFMGNTADILAAGILEICHVPRKFISKSPEWS